jgi:hypothetical protein
LKSFAVSWTSGPLLPPLPFPSLTVSGSPRT